jgi:hypothetical protein
MKKEKKVAPQATRKVVVYRHRWATVNWSADQVLEVPADMTDKQIEEIANELAEDLPEPNEWEQEDCGEPEDASENPLFVIRKALKREKADARFVADANLRVKVVADEDGSGGSTNG